jgi:NADPH:quinone reductase-like Zn-dependent oxidoreductase
MTRAIVSDGAGGFTFADAPDPVAARGEAIVRVETIGLNRGDLRIVATAKAGARLGWDFAGTVTGGSARGLPEGSRVAGLLPGMGAWATEIAVPGECLAIVPGGVTIETAAALPSAGLTALYTLENAGALIGRAVLVTGASGGVGHLACQLATIGGARVTGLVRGEAGAGLLRSLDAGEVATDIGAAQAQAPFDILIDSVGGKTLSAALGLLAPHARCIAFGATEAREVPLDVFRLYQEQLEIAGFGLFPAIASGRTVRDGLTRLLALVDRKRLRVHLGERSDWRALGDVAKALATRQFTGKAILEVAR